MARPMLYRLSREVAVVKPGFGEFPCAILGPSLIEKMYFGMEDLGFIFLSRSRSNGINDREVRVAVKLAAGRPFDYTDWDGVEVGRLSVSAGKADVSRVWIDPCVNWILSTHASRLMHCSLERAVLACTDHLKSDKRLFGHRPTARDVSDFRLATLP